MRIYFYTPYFIKFYQLVCNRTIYLIFKHVLVQWKEIKYDTLM
jgi:hypothetical protein